MGRRSNIQKNTTAYLGIGTNKGSRKRNIQNAINLLTINKNIKVIKVSKLLKNPPQEGIKSGYFLNGAIKIKTNLIPLKLLKACKDIEKKLGRPILSFNHRRITTKKKSRIIDLDILLYGNKVLNTPVLKIPHQKLTTRYFVLKPLMDLNKNLKHPVLNKNLNKLYLDLKKD